MIIPTQALLNIMMNAEGIQLGDELTSFKGEFSHQPRTDMLADCRKSYQGALVVLCNNM
jgi:hypothetical protein